MQALTLDRDLLRELLGARSCATSSIPGRCLRSSATCPRLRRAGPDACTTCCAGRAI